MLDQKLINEAVALYIGHGVLAHPCESPERLKEKYGDKTSELLLPVIKKLFDEADSFKPDWSLDTLNTACAKLKKRMQEHHPSLDPNAINAIEWAFSYWWWK